MGPSLNKDFKNIPADYPSIFNDVIGPVMRGPSSSPCAAALYIGSMARDLMDGRLEEVTIEFDPNGSLATTHDSKGLIWGSSLAWFATLWQIELRCPAWEKCDGRQ